MKFYTSVTTIGNKMYVRDVDGDRESANAFDFSPTLYVSCQESQSDGWKTIYGTPAKSVNFGNIKEAKDYINQFNNVDGMEVFGSTAWHLQYIQETYPGEMQFSTDKMRIWTIDLECTAENGFPDIEKAVEKILLISVKDRRSDEIHTWSCKKTNIKGSIHYYPDEASMLSAFIEYWRDNTPHIVTGWNVEKFDMIYLGNRIKNVLGDAWLKLLSPFRRITERMLEVRGKEYTLLEPVGVSVLDYMDLYKKFVLVKQESYSLDHIATVELGVGKKDNPFETFKDFYTKDYDSFTEYNRIDVLRVDELEDKLQLIELAVFIAYYAKCNYNDVFSPIRTWDAVLYNYLTAQKTVIPQRSRASTYEIEGGYVKDPVPGIYKWICSFDFTSLYPSIIRALNISPEMIRGQVDVSIDKILASKEDTSLYAKNVAGACNGWSFARETQGIFPKLITSMFNERKAAKNIMIQAKKDYEATKDENHKKISSAMNNKQNTLKTLLNSLFGAMANKHFRFGDSRLAEGITSSGQCLIQFVGARINSYLAKITGENIDFAFYQDTDSCYVTFDALVEKYYKNSSKEEIIKILDKICSTKMQDIINLAIDDYCKMLNAFEPSAISMKREAISDVGFWIAKKKYALRVYDNEGVYYKDGDLKVMGIEIVRSSTPRVIRDWLKECIPLVLDDNLPKLRLYVEEKWNEFKTLDVEDIAFPRGANNLSQYSSSSTIYQKGCPIHVRGCLLYNHYIKEFGVVDKYQEIAEGEKIKFVYLKLPNTIKENIISFSYRFPKEFGINQFVDYNTQWNKAFIAPLDNILKAVGWELEEKSTLEDFFG